MQVLSLIFSADFLYNVLRATTAILFATLAAGVAAKAAMFNIAVEGIMLSAALTGVLVSALLQNAWLGLLGALLMGALLGLLLGFLVLKLKTDMILAGVAINLMAAGGTIFALYLASGDRGVSSSVASVSLPNLTLPLLEKIPLLGGMLYNQNVLTYLAFLAVPLMHIFLYQTPMGLRIRAVGENPNAAESVGVNLLRVRYGVLLLSGVLAACGGAFLSMGYISWFTANMTAGRGFIGLTAAAMASNNPLGSMLVSLLFGSAGAIVNIFQTGVAIPYELVQMLPYISTIVLFTVFSYRRIVRARMARSQHTD